MFGHTMLSPKASKRFASFGSLALLGILVLTGCQAGAGAAPQPNASVNQEVGLGAAETQLPLSELTPLALPREYQGGSTAILREVLNGPLIQNPQITLPATVTSYERSGNRQVTVTDTSRILALSMNGNLASLVTALGLGDRLIARDVASDEPELQDLPVVTKAGHTIEAETIIGLNPSIIITDGSIGPLDVVLQLREAGITLVFVERESSFDGSYRIAQQLADALGVPKAGQELSSLLKESIEQKIAEIQQLIPIAPENRVRMAFLYVRGTAKIYYLFGSESGADTLIQALGGVDIASDTGWVGMRPVTDEAIIELNPDLLLVMSDGLASVGGVDGLFDALPALKLTKAGEHRRVVDMADTEVLGFGPDMAGVLDALARVIYAPGQ